MHDTIQTAETVRASIRDTDFATSRTHCIYSDDQQRACFFGHVLFGRARVLADELGMKATWDAGFVKRRYSWEEIATMINEGLKASKDRPFVKA